MKAHLERALLLRRQGRSELAERELRAALGQEPESALAKALLAECVSDLGRTGEALELAREAVGQAPDQAFVHVVLAQILGERKQRREALSAIDEAIRLAPEDATSRAVKATLLIRMQRWQEALDAARQGLELDPEDARCSNLESLCLQQLGRKDEAARAADEALQKDPDDALSHANRGWVYLRQGDHVKAEKHFREALRLEPGNEWARDGVIRSINARNPLYRGILRFWMWAGTLSSGAAWVLILALVFGRRILRSIANSSPELAPWANAGFWAITAFVLLTWIADPLFNLTLRLHPLGRHALSPDERRSSNLVGLLLLGALGAALSPWFAPTPFAGPLALGLVAYTIPVAATFAAEPGDGRSKRALFTVVLGAVGVVAAALAFGGFLENARVVGAVYVLGFVGFTWVIVLRGSSRPE